MAAVVDLVEVTGIRSMELADNLKILVKFLGASSELIEKDLIPLELCFRAHNSVEVL